MKSAVLVFLTSLLVLHVQGHPDNKSSKCKCLSGFIGKVSSRFIKGEPVIHLPSIFCPHTEIIITTTADKEKCVNPQSPVGKLIMENYNKQKKNGAAGTTTTSSQTTQSSTKLRTESRL